MSNTKKNAVAANTPAACCGACDCTNCSCGCPKGACRCAETNCKCGCRAQAK